MRSLLVIAVALLILSRVATADPVDQNRNHSKASDKFTELIQNFNANTKSLVPKNIAYEYLIHGDDGGRVEFDEQQNRFSISIGERFFWKQPTVDAGLAFLCHELGHAAASNGKYVSEEEQADYWTSSVCLPHILKFFPDESTITTPFDEQFRDRCELSFDNLKRARLCVRTLTASYLFRALYINDEFSQAIYFTSDRRSMSCTPVIDKKLPNISQCAFNFMVAGALQMPRPVCTNMIMMSERYTHGNFSSDAFTEIFNNQCERAAAQTR